MKRMIFICEAHVIEGLKITYAPHIQKLAKRNNSKCAFCREKAMYKLYYFYLAPGFEKDSSRVACS